MRERLNYDHFVLPFTIGLVYIIAFLTVATIRVIKSLPYEDKKKLGKSIFNIKILYINIKEIFSECLFHRKIFKKNSLLGYMHMSIAFGWFMMILLGHLEVKLYCPHRFNQPYYPIFFRYFMMETETTLKGSLIFFLMDFFLAMTLSGVILAVYKRFNSKRFGMRVTTKLKLGDTVAMYALWAIFPLRLLAESFTSNVSGGSFLTRGFGMIFENFVSNPDNTLPIWWAYSIALGLFFVALPHSRFMHIPTEVLLIFMRNAGIKVGKTNTGYAKAGIYSCSRCGICIDPCQMSTIGSLRKKTTVYYIRQQRHKDPERFSGAFDCMMCGRCVDACPVGIDSCSIKQNLRNTEPRIGNENQYDYLKKNAPTQNSEVDVLYFAGCMTHLTPTVKSSMIKIMRRASVNFGFPDEDGSICCGRPLMLAGQRDAAQKLMEANKKIFENSNAKTLVTSCPICYRIFNETYKSNIEVLHHTQYIERLVNEGKLTFRRTEKNIVFHDSCELGRFSNIYDPPRNILRKIGNLQTTPVDGKNGICCGGSIGSVSMKSSRRKKIATEAMEKLTADNPDCLVTSCPLCKKTFDSVGKTPVKDISQIVAESIV